MIWSGTLLTLTLSLFCHSVVHRCGAGSNKEPGVLWWGANIFFFLIGATASMDRYQVYIDADRDRIKSQECCGGVMVVELTSFFLLGTAASMDRYQVYIDADRDGIKSQECCGGVMVVELTSFFLLGTAASMDRYQVYIDAERDRIKSQECCCGGVGGANVLLSHRNDCLNGSISR
ncbi:MAG: hypothetical protein J3Q66DRAFT_160143 [Benniella sp.]|nr:MAG: hypothetical protein J3Q66DRAFT_160143 [Benniella sp.]